MFTSTNLVYNNNISSTNLVYNNNISSTNLVYSNNISISLCSSAFRHSTQASSNALSSTYSNKHLFDRKRPNVASVPHHTPALKRTRMMDALVDSLRAREPKSTSRKLTVPEIEYESDGESVSGGGGGSVREDSVEPLDANSTGARSIGNGERRGSATPPVQEEEEEEDVELKKKVSHPLCVGLTISKPHTVKSNYHSMHLHTLLSYPCSQFSTVRTYFRFQCKLWSHNESNTSCGRGLRTRLRFLL